MKSQENEGRGGKKSTKELNLNAVSVMPSNFRPE
jgi:hypothetical protein